MLTSRSVHATPNRLDVGAPGLDGAVRFVHAGRRVRRRLLQRAARPGDAVGGHPRVSNTCVNPAGLGEDAGFGGDGPPADAPMEDVAHWLPYCEVPDADAAVGRAREPAARSGRRPSTCRTWGASPSRPIRTAPASR
ncbi:hypothetical protein [Streptomyces cinereospinus]|uniref:Uncharacterized protein n=1 Tax=Streptomyces cinereospinus TaxID=285561 RepID=A0ABV5MZ65_9ACTN